MKKRYAFLLAFLGMGQLGLAQRSELEVKTNYKKNGIPRVSARMSDKVNDNLFLMFKEIDKKKSAIVAYDANLTEKFNIPLTYGEDASPLFKYSPTAEKIFVVESYGKTNPYSKKGHGFIASVYDAQGKQLKQKTVELDIPRISPTLEASHEAQFSENGQYFYTLEKEGRKGEGPVLTVYDLQLETLFKKEIKLGAKEKIEASAIGNDGGVVAVLSDAKTTAKFIKLDTKGKEVARLAVKHSLQNREAIDHYTLKLVGDRALIAAEKVFNKSELMAIHLFDADFSAKTTKLYKTKEFNTEYVAQVYGKVHDKDVLNGGKTFSKKFDRPKNITFMAVQEIIIDGANIYLVSEGIKHKTSVSTSTTPVAGVSGQMKTTTKYTPLQYAEDILITSFENGENKWNSLIGRTMLLRDLGGADMLKAMVNHNSQALHIITSESPKGEQKDISLYARSVNKATGEISSPKRIKEGSFITYTNFACWLDSNKVVLFRSNQVAFGKGYTLEKVALQ
ncbi:hypothetical protein [Rufibacter sp. LB8]|uniref:hypothetical protein n=1 Tax=Rufibacter sp. LB8 TaxID=2777781 RepID=UPI00178C2FF8|nr:hypothetical protein [Rufibacter sp. LB8]